MEMRRRLDKRAKPAKTKTPPTVRNGLQTLIASLGRELHRDRATTMAALEKLLGALGYYVVSGTDAAAEARP
jgi:hypothetical protein